MANKYVCPECDHQFEDTPVCGQGMAGENGVGSVICPECEFHFNVGEEENIPEAEEPNDSMDGDHDSAMRDAGFGTDEDYGPGASEIY